MSLPAGVSVLFADYGEEFEDAVEVTPMESGPARYSLRQSLNEVRREANLIMDAATYATFKAWYTDTIKRVGEWDFVDPVDGQTKKARFYNGQLGKAAPRQSHMSNWVVPCVIVTAE